MLLIFFTEPVLEGKQHEDNAAHDKDPGVGVKIIITPGILRYKLGMIIACYPGKGGYNGICDQHDHFEPTVHDHGNVDGAEEQPDRSSALGTAVCKKHGGKEYKDQNN